MNQKILRCTLCHCTDVTCKAHVKPNSDNQFVDYSSDEDDIKNGCYCNRCETHVLLEEVDQEEIQPLSSLVNTIYAMNADKPFSVFTDTDQWTWVADYSDPNEYAELDELFRYLCGDIGREDMPTDYANIADNELKQIYNSRFLIMFGRAMQEIGKSLESGAIKINIEFRTT